MNGAYLAIDIGASSMKVIAARLDGKRLALTAENTLPYKPFGLNGHIYVNPYGLYDAIKNEIGRLVAQGGQFVSFGIDTYGNGYGIFDREMSMIGLPYFYKDARTQGILETVAARLPLWEIYEETGVNPTDIRVLMQLFYETISNPAKLKTGARFLLLPDILGYFFTGVRRAERSMVSVANLLSRKNGDWCYGLLEKLSIPTHLFPEIVEGGDPQGMAALTSGVREELGSGSMRLASVTAHDTEAALLAAPVLDEQALFISLGSSIICGVKTPAQVICEEGYRNDFKNMYGAFGRNSLCRNFNGLWMLEQCLSLWRQQDSRLTYADVYQACLAAGRNNTFLDVEDAMIRCPQDQGSIIDAIAGYCACTNQPAVTSIGEIANCIFESIALQVKWTFEQLQRLAGRRDYRGVSVIGGGVRNGLLLQMIADALGLPVYTGSPYSAAMGNILMQMHAAGELGCLEEMQEVSCNSCEMGAILPKGSMDKWDAALTCMESNQLIMKTMRGSHDQKN